MSSLLQVRHSQELPAAWAPAVPAASEERSAERGCSEEVRCCLAGAGGVLLGICIFWHLALCMPAAVLQRKPLWYIPPAWL